MPSDPSGNYALPASYFVQVGDTVLPVQHNVPFEDVAQALTNRIMRDGRTVMTGNLQMGGNKVTNVAPGTNDGDALNVLQLRDRVDAVADFATVADMLADNSQRIGYADSGARVIVASGQIVTAQGFRYEVAASGATDAHVETGGGVRLKVLPGVNGYDVKAFGALGDGVADDTDKFHAAWTAARLLTTMAPGSHGSGCAGIYAPKGFYRVTDNIIPDGGNVGLFFRGDGPRATTIFLDATSKTLMKWRTYLHIDVHDISFYTGDLTFSGGLPQVSVSEIKTNTCASFDSTNSGSRFAWRNCDFFGFRADFSSKTSTVNCDNHLHDFCSFYYSDVVWENSNTQAVLWWFNGCKFFYTSGAVFDDPAADLAVLNSDVIIPGIWLKARGNSLGLDASFKAVRFEKYQNIDPSSEPKILDIAGPGGHTNIVFDHCTNRGGGSLLGKTSATISGLFDVTMRDCSGFEGNWDVSPNTSFQGQTGRIEFERCSPGINIVQTLSPAQGNTPANIIINDQKAASGAGRSRRFLGNISGHTGISSGGVMSDYVRIVSVVNNTSVGREVSIFCPGPYRMVFAGADISLTNNTTFAVTVNIYADSTRAKKLGSVTSASTASGVWQALSIPASALLEQHSITSSSSPIYVELEASGNAGTVTANINLNYVQGG